MRVTSGTQGTVTGLPEHALNLTVSLLLREELERRGYDVLMTRETADVSISNAERAALANEAEADALVRIHANGSEDPADHGALTICMTPENPYCGALYAQSRLLSEYILDGLCEKTGADRLYVWETDTMTGINYAQMPVTIVEMGYLTNPEEEQLLSDPEYQQRLAEGIADGIDRYFACENPALQQALGEALEDADGQWAVWAEDLTTGVITTACRDSTPETPMVSASIIKLFIMGAVYDQANDGLLELEAVYDDVYAMITVSDNDACNRLIDVLGGGTAAGMRVVNEFAASLGLSSVALNRPMLTDNGLQNYASVADCAAFLRMLHAESCVNPAASQAMLDILLAQTGHDYIPAGVPEGVEIAHKGGDLLGLCQGDVGIVYCGETPYLVCILCNHPGSFSATTEKIVSLSDLIYRHFSGEA